MAACAAALLLLQVARAAPLSRESGPDTARSGELCDVAALMTAAVAAQAVCPASWHLSVFVGHAVWSSQQVALQPRASTFCSHGRSQLVGEVARGDWALSMVHDVSRNPVFDGAD